MEQRVSLITLGVTDLARARRFYEALGWRASEASQEGVVFFQANGLAVALFGREALAEDAKSELAEGPGALTLAYNARSKAEVDAIFAEALEAGATPRKRPVDVFWGGYSGYFADPDGHLWEVAWNPFFGLDAQGHLSLAGPA